MSPPSWFQSTADTVVDYVMKRAHHSRPGVEVIVDGHTPEKTYTTFDAVAGIVKITAPHQQNVPFDEVRITLQGQAKTFVEKLSAAGSRSITEARHSFLTLAMPMRDSDYPQPRVAKAGEIYTFPFNVRPAWFIHCEYTEYLWHVGSKVPIHVI